jgi:outer membrane protein assembly factor BamB
VLIAVAAAPARGGTPDEVRGSVLAVDVATGTTRWAASVDAIALGPPSVSGGLLTVLGVQMPVRCQFDVSTIELDAASGRLASAASLRPVDVPFSSSDPNVRHLAADGVATPPNHSRRPRNASWRASATRCSRAGSRQCPRAAPPPTWQRVVPAAGPPALAHGDDVLVVASLASTVAASIGEDTMPLHVEALDLATGTTRWTATTSADGPFDVHRLGQHDVRFAPVAGSYPWDQDPGGHLILNHPGYGEQSVAILGGRVYVPHSSPMAFGRLDG